VTTEPIPDEVVRQTLLQAILTTHNTDTRLFIDHTHERSIMFHVGRRLACEVDTWPGDWSVDLEYNRDRGAVKRGNTFSGEQAKRILPDLMIHHRGRQGPHHNLLVLEAKLAVSDPGRREDHEKLAGIVEKYNYRHAVYLEFGQLGAGPRWHWIAESGQLRACLPTHTICAARPCVS